jgi:hypothetical protein
MKTLSMPERSFGRYLPRGLRLVLVGLAYLAGAPSARACEKLRVCVQFELQAQDGRCSSSGDMCECSANNPCDSLPLRSDADLEIVPAAGVNARIFRPGGEPNLIGRLDAEGCMEFWSDYDSGHFIEVEQVAAVGASGNLTLQGSLSPKSAGVAGDVEDCNPPGSSSRPRWPVQAFSKDAGLVILSSGGDQAMEVFPWALYVLNRFDTACPTCPRVQHDRSLTAYANCFSGPGAHTFGMPGFIVVKVNPEEDAMANCGGDCGLVRRKYIVGHEMGHTFQQVFMNGSLLATGSGDPNELDDWLPDGAPSAEFPETTAPAYGYKSTDLDCGMNDTAENGSFHHHHLRSSEGAMAAFVEGFAHFMATAAFNDLQEQNPLFHYYKWLLEDGTVFDFIDTVPYTPPRSNFTPNHHRVAVRAPEGVEPPMLGEPGALGGTRRWFESKCVNDAATSSVVYPGGGENNVELGSELDWLRFLWAFMTDPDPALDPRPNFGEMLVWTMYAFHGEHEHPVPGPSTVTHRFRWFPGSAANGLCEALEFGTATDVEDQTMQALPQGIAGFNVDLTTFRDRFLAQAIRYGIDGGMVNGCQLPP